MLAPHLTAVWLAWKGRAFESGLAAGVAFLCNVKGLFVLAGCAVFAFPALPLLAAGFAIPCAVAAALLPLDAYVAQVWVWSSLYAGSTFLLHPLWNGVVRTLNWLGFHAALVAGAVGRMPWKFVAWLGISFVAVAVGWRFFPRYYLQLLPPMVILASRAKGRRMAMLVGVLLLVPLIRFGPRYVETALHRPWSDVAMDNDSRAAAKLVRRVTSPGDTMFVWGYRPELWVYTGLPDATRFLDSQALTGVPADRHLTQSEPVTVEGPRAARAELARSRPDVRTGWLERFQSEALCERLSGVARVVFALPAGGANVVHGDLSQGALVQSGVPRILVTGGAGYIGSHTVLQLTDRGYDVVVVDNLSRGYKDAVDPKLLRVVDIHDTAGLVHVLEEKPCDAVIHFAAYIAVGESMKLPEIYFENNVAGSLSLFTAMVKTGVKHAVFSSTAAVYGMPSVSPITEDLPYAAINPYGESKVMTEKILAWFDRIHELRSVCLRYFNASGADPDGRAGERHDPETHLIPLLFRAIQTGQPVNIFGEDYPTPDGTCVRDYIHVTDLAQAHILAVEALLKGAPSNRFNVGTGHGYSVLEVIRSVESVTGKKVPYQVSPRREGDPPELVADSTKLQHTLGWKPEFSELNQIVSTAWKFANR